MRRVDKIRVSLVAKGECIKGLHGLIKKEIERR